jgi:hypothetical protein
MNNISAIALAGEFEQLGSIQADLRPEFTLLVWSKNKFQAEILI